MKPRCCDAHAGDKVFRPGDFVDWCGERIDEVYMGNPLSTRALTGSVRFHELLKAIGDLHDKKQGDYGRPTDPFANVRASVDFGIPGWVGALVRANDKMRRLQGLAQGNPLNNEGAMDSFLDLAVYALIAACLFEEDQR